MLYEQNNIGAVTMHSDKQLLQRIAADDKDAFTQLYHRYWEDLLITAAKALRAKEEAADVVQDVFLSVWNRRNELNIQGSLGAYLHTCVRYKCIHYIERNITRRDYLLLLTEIEINTPSVNAETNLQLKEIQQAISKTVSEMPPKMQEVYKMSRQEHLTHKEISENMHISVETVKKHIQHALYLIKAELPPYTIILIVLTFFYYC